MNVGIFAGKQTKSLISYLEANFQKEILLSVLFPEEDISQSDVEMVILEETQVRLIPALLSLPNPPHIVVSGYGISRDNLHYLTDFQAEFPKLWKETRPREATITFIKENRKFVYRQTDIIAVTKDIYVTVHLRSGNRIAPIEGFRKICSKLSSDLFFPVSKTAMANILYVSQMKPDAVQLENGLILPFSPEEKKSVENAFYKIKFRENRPQRKK